MMGLAHRVCILAETNAAPPWISLVMLSAALVLLAAVIWQRARSKRSSDGVGGEDPKEVEVLVRDLIAELDTRADRLERLIAEAERVTRLPRTAPTPAAPRRAIVHEPAQDPVAARIYGLADEGLPTVEIARRLEQPTGKVELILALRDR